MRRAHLIPLVLAWAFLSMTTSAAQPSSPDLNWQQLPPLPDKLGLGGAFGGTSRGALIIAGGSNFPDKMPWDGGIKAWLDNVYVLEKPGAEWKTEFKVPVAFGYGVSASTPQGLVCAGGSDARGHLTNVLLLAWTRGKLKIQNLPPLPVPLAYSCGAALGDLVYVAGGTLSPTATSTRNDFFRLDMQHLDRGWQILPSWPSRPRMLATAACVNGSFYMVGGTDLHADPKGGPERTYLKDGYCFTPGKGWKRIADMPNPVVAGPNPAPVIGEKFLVIGGDDGSFVNFEPRSQHPGFPKRVLCYDTLEDRWTIEADAPVSRATLPTADWQGLHVLISGEARPGVRSPEVWAFRTAQEATETGGNVLLAPKDARAQPTTRSEKAQ